MMQKTVCFYVLLAARGVFLITEFRALYYRAKDYELLEQIKATKQTFLGTCMVEALTQTSVVESITLTERLPVADDEEVKLKRFIDMQYLLLTGIREFRTHEEMLHTATDNSELAAKEFLDTLGLSKRLNHYIYQSD